MSEIKLCKCKRCNGQGIIRHYERSTPDICFQCEGVGYYGPLVEFGFRIIDLLMTVYLVFKATVTRKNIIYEPLARRKK